MADAGTSAKTRWLVAAAIVVTAAVGVGVGAAIASGDDTSSSAGGAPASQQLAGWRQACQQWTGSYVSSNGPGPGSGWCHGMSDWMYDQMRNGTMGPMMMWGDPARMRDACRQWATTDPTASPDADTSTWCDTMVNWMTDHMGNWGNWDDERWDQWMHGPMMGS